MPRARNETLIAAFADELSAARVSIAMSQEELAHRAGVDRTFIWLLETGRRQPTISVLFALAAGLNITPEAFVERVRRAMRIPSSATHGGVRS